MILGIFHRDYGELRSGDSGEFTPDADRGQTFYPATGMKTPKMRGVNQKKLDELIIRTRGNRLYERRHQQCVRYRN